MLDDEDGVAALDKAVECGEELGDVVEVEAGGGFVEDEEYGLFGDALDEEGGELDALRFAAGEGAGGLAEGEVAEAHLLQWHQPLVYAAGLVAVEECHRLVDGHLQHLADVLAIVEHFEGFFLVARTVTLVADEVYVAHELHADGDFAFALAGLASSAFDVEGKEAAFVAAAFGKGLLGVESAHLVEDFHVGGWVGSRGASDGVLVDHFDGGDTSEVAIDGDAVADVVGSAVESPLQHVVEHAAYQGALARARHAGDDGHHAEGYIHVDLLQVVGVGAFDADAVAPAAALGGHLDGLAARQVVEGEGGVRS